MLIIRSKLKIFFSSIFVFFISACVAIGQDINIDKRSVEAKWQLIGPGDADQVTSVSVMDNGSVFIGTDIGGLYISNDRGRSWSSRNQGLLNYDITTPVLQHQKDDDVLFVGTRGGVYKSDDGGINWRNIRAGLPKVMRYKLSGSVGAIAIDPFNQKRMLMGLGYRTSAEGSTTVRKLKWSKYIYISNDYGENWQQKKAFEEKAKVYQILYSSTKDLVYAATSNGLYESQDGGGIWKKILDKQVYNVVLYPEQKKIVAACGSEGVYTSVNNGSKWRLSNQGLSLGFVHELFSKEVRYSMLVKDPSDVDRLFLLNSTWGMSGGLYISDDKGQTWAKYTKAMPESWLKTSKRMNAVAFDQNNSSNVYMGSSRYIYRSSDGGKNWQQAISNGTKDKWTHTGINIFGHTRDFLVDPEKPTRFFMATADHGLVESNTAGMDWKKVEKGLGKITTVPDMDACMNKTDSNYGKIIILAQLLDKTPCIAHTDDEGEWKSDCSLNQNIDRPTKLVIDQADCKTMYMGARNGLFTSANSGLSWTQVSFGRGGDTKVTDIVVDEYSRVLVATNTGLFTFEKDGKDVNKAVAFPDKEVTSIYLSQLSPDVIFAGVKKASKKGSALFRSNNGGRGWDKVLESTGFFSGMVQRAKAPYSIYAATNDHNYHDQSAGSGVYKSDDGGNNWQSFNKGLPVLRAWNIATGGENSNDVYLCANGSGVFVLQ